MVVRNGLDAHYWYEEMTFLNVGQSTLGQLLTLYFVIALGVMITLFRTRMVHDRSLTPGLFLPIVGLSTDAVVGASICVYASEISPRLAVPVIIVAYMLSGFALWFSIMLYTLYLHRLMAVGFPEPGKTPQLFLLVLSNLDGPVLYQSANV